MEVFVEVLQGLVGSTQILMTSFNPNILKLRNCVFLEVEMDQQSKISEIQGERAEQIIRTVVKAE